MDDVEFRLLPRTSLLLHPKVQDSYFELSQYLIFENQLFTSLLNCTFYSSNIVVALESSHNKFQVIAGISALIMANTAKMDLVPSILVSTPPKGGILNYFLNDLLIDVLTSIDRKKVLAATHDILSQKLTLNSDKFNQDLNTIAPEKLTQIITGESRQSIRTQV